MNGMAVPFGKVEERSLALVGLISQISTLAPSSMNFSTMPFPKPEPPPVVMQILSWRRGPGIFW